MGLKDKASKIDFASLMPVAAPTPDVTKPKTAPGAMMALANDQRSNSCARTICCAGKPRARRSSRGA